MCSRNTEDTGCFTKDASMKILIVDDVPLMLRSLQLLLERNGHEVLTAQTGEAALDCLSTDSMIDVIITDLVMQPMNGVELFRQAQIVERFNDSGVVPPPPFVLLTSCEKTGSRASWEAELYFARREFAAILQKPISEKDLIPALEAITAAEAADS